MKTPGGPRLHESDRRRSLSPGRGPLEQDGAGTTWRLGRERPEAGILVGALSGNAGIENREVTVPAYSLSPPTSRARARSAAAT